MLFQFAFTSSSTKQRKQIRESQQHELNIASWQQFLQSEPIDAQLNAERRRILEPGSKERQSRYEVLPILLDVTNTLARLHLPFRGHDETDTSTNMASF